MSKTVWVSPLKFLIAHPYFGFQANKKLFSTWVYNIVYHRTMARLTYHVHIHWISYMIYSWHMQAHGPSLSSSQGCSRVCLEMQHPTSAHFRLSCLGLHISCSVVSILFKSCMYRFRVVVDFLFRQHICHDSGTLAHQLRNRVSTYPVEGMWWHGFVYFVMSLISMVYETT